MPQIREIDFFCFHNTEFLDQLEDIYHNRNTGNMGIPGEIIVLVGSAAFL